MFTKAEKNNGQDRAFESGSGLKRAMIFKRLRGLGGQGPMCTQTIMVCGGRGKGGRGKEGERERVCMYLVCLFAEETIGAEDLTDMQIKLAFLCRSGLTVQRDIQIGVRCRC